MEREKGRKARERVEGEGKEWEEGRPPGPGPPPGKKFLATPLP